MTMCEAATVVDLDLPDGLTLPDGSPLPIALPGIPITIDGMTIYLGVLDRDVILARKGVPYSVVPYNAICPLPAGDGCNYQTVASAELAVNVPGVGPVPVLVKFQRGFVGVDVKVDTVPYRFVNTHLETRLEEWGEPGRYFQSAQAAELLQFMLLYMPPETGRRLLLVGDMNSDPRDEVFPTVLPGYPPIVGVPPYQQYTALASFTDIWTKRPGAATGKGAPLVGFSCCQARGPAQPGSRSCTSGSTSSSRLAPTEGAGSAAARRVHLGQDAADRLRPVAVGPCVRRDTLAVLTRSWSNQGRPADCRGALFFSRATVFPDSADMDERTRDRCIGAIVGLAVGDALGTTLEFRRPGSFTPIDDMVGGGPFNLEPGFWTDDTSMALCLAESLAECGRIQRDRPDAALPALVQRRSLVIHRFLL